MSKKKTYIALAVILAVVIALVAGGGEYLWRLLLAMHGKH